MKYVLLIYETDPDFDARREGADSEYIGAWRAYYRAIADAGIFVGGAPLKDVATATTVRRREDRRLVQDGPFADTKERLGGFMVLELPSLDAALDWAARCPAAASGAVELRPMDERTHDTIVGP